MYPGVTREEKKSGVRNLHLKLAGKTWRKLPQGEEGEEGSAREEDNFCRESLPFSPIFFGRRVPSNKFSGLHPIRHVVSTE